MGVNSKQTKMRKLKREKGTTVIPYGYYCYNGNETCPYWDVADCKHEQPKSDITLQGVCCGYCWFLEKGDHQENGTSLLFDQVKKCGENK